MRSSKQHLIVKVSDMTFEAWTDAWLSFAHVENAFDQKNLLEFLLPALKKVRTATDQCRTVAGLVKLCLAALRQQVRQKVDKKRRRRGVLCLWFWLPNQSTRSGQLLWPCATLLVIHLNCDRKQEQQQNCHHREKESEENETLSFLYGLSLVCPRVAKWQDPHHLQWESSQGKKEST